MKKKVIYTSILNKETSHFIKHMYEVYSWEPTIIILDKHLLPHYKKQFPNTIFLISMEMRQNKFDYKIIESFQSIDQNIIDKLSTKQSNFLSWLQDTSGWNFSFIQRRDFYYQNLNFFNSLLKQYKVDLFISFTWPHVTCDYALYLMCKKVFYVPVLFYDVIPHFENQSRIIHSSYENMSETINCFYKNQNLLKENLNHQAINEYIENITCNKPKLKSNIINFYKSNSFSFKELFIDLLKFLKQLLFLQLGNKSNLAFKKNRKRFSKYSQLNQFDEFNFKYKTMLNNFILKRVYFKLCEKFNLNENYIYYPGPLQPEAISNLIPGVYEDCFLILDMIKTCIPKNWKVFYKEHPATFSPKSQGSLGKNIDFFERLKKYDFIKIIPFETNTYSLIDNSQCVITAGGSTGWEALMRNKPCILFGNMWYEDCKSVFKIKKIDDLKNAFLQITSGKKPDSEDVQFYLKCMFLASSNKAEYLNVKKIEINFFEDYIKSLPSLGKDLVQTFNRVYQKN